MRSNVKKKLKTRQKVARVIIAVLMVILVVFVATRFDGVKETVKDKVVKKTEVEIIAAGDNLYHMPVVNAGRTSDGGLDFEYIYEPVKEDVSAADIAVINQETILGGPSLSYTGYPTFNTPWEAGEAVEATGFDVLTCASNHTVDKGERGVNGAFEFFDNHPNLMEIGINKSEEEYNTIDYYEKNDIKFALLNYTYGTNGIPTPAGKPWIVNQLDKDKITKDVTEAKENADVVIVFPHWGTEYYTGIDDEQAEYTKLFSDLGVDIVIGTHPHVIAPVEWVENEETGKKMLVYYSLGNFVSNQPDAIQQLGAMAKIKIQKQGDEITILEATAIPTVTHVEDANKIVRVYKLDDYTDELAKKNHSHSSVEYFKNKAKEILGDFVEMKEAS